MIPRGLSLLRRLPQRDGALRSGAMKSIKHLPDDPPPLVERAPASTFGSVAGGFPGVAAKLSLCAGLFSFLLGHHAATAKIRLSHGALQGVFLVFSVAVIVMNLIADCLYFVLDPRVQTA